MPQDEGYAINVLREGSKITVEWKSDDAEDVERARRLFSKLTRQGWLAVLVSPDGQRILKFKPEHGRLRFVPLSEGG